MFRAAFAILLFTLLLGLAGAPPEAWAQDKVLDETAFVPVNPPRAPAGFLFEDENGRTLDLKEFRGRYVLLNIWATFCSPCVAEMPKLDALSAKLDKKRWTIVALAEDHDGAAVAHIFYKHHDIHNLAVYNDRTGRAPFVLQTRGLPTTLLINPQGEEIARLEGPADWGKDSMVAFLKARATP